MPERFVEWQRSAGPRQTHHQRLALDVLHHQEIDRVVLTDLVEMTAVRIVKGSNDARFALEAEVYLVTINEGVNRPPVFRPAAREKGASFEIADGGTPNSVQR